MRRLVLALVLMVAGAATAAAADDFPYGNTHSFAVYRNGQLIGSHNLAFQGNGQQRAVTTSIDFAVKAMGLTVYRYSHRGNEVWNGSILKSIDTKTDDNLLLLKTELGAGHGGMDFVMLYRIIECLRKGEPMDQNVYEGAFWSSVSELSEYSVAQGGMPQVFPDFTRGDWKTTAPLGIVQ